MGRKVFAGWNEEDGKRTPLWKERKVPITLRQMLTHSHGSACPMFNKEQSDIMGGIEGWAPGHLARDWVQTLLESPLMQQPGEKYEYGLAFEEIGVLVERLSGRHLYDQFTKEIFEPLGMKDSYWQYEVPEEKQSRLYPTYMKMPAEDGGFTFVDDAKVMPPPPPGLPSSKELFPHVKGRHGASGGSQIVTTATDYTALLAALLNGGLSPETGNRILSPELAKMFFTPQLTKAQVTGTRNLGATTPLSVPVSFEALDPEGNIGLGPAIQGALRKLVGGGQGRSAGTAYWYGFKNTEWWADPEKGIAAVVMTSYGPFMDSAFPELVNEVEREIYKSLA
ncbi:beta-lactamase/transpeptidase-like protein [Lineolata rhizophorae]|uniref:Beta-lactamase/transpeptidase-like protein n=1 Tax=Lineolata rhizophorae TaxID=578093 RepID=A0A6A6P3K8_9PEZI|nr:beta-lactamase/transpeptidase-like protein [Lineolata rhizophorae]